jgi:hypothetical protein
MEEVVAAIFAVERVFRLLPRIVSKKDDCISINANILSFLRTHCKEYYNYFSRERGYDSSVQGNSIIIKGLSEDQQIDDMAILAIRRKA